MIMLAGRIAVLPGVMRGLVSGLMGYHAHRCNRIFVKVCRIMLLMIRLHKFRHNR